MTFRWWALVKLPMIAPRASGVAAPHATGGGPAPPVRGCDASTMCFLARRLSLMTFGPAARATPRGPRGQGSALGYLIVIRPSTLGDTVPRLAM